MDGVAAFVGEDIADVIFNALFARMMISRCSMMGMVLDGMMRRFMMGGRLRWLLLRGEHTRHGGVVLALVMR